MLLPCQKSHLAIIIVYSTTRIVAKQRILNVLKVFTALLAASYYIIVAPEKPLGNFYIITYSARRVIHIQTV